MWGCYLFLFLYSYYVCIYRIYDANELVGQTGSIMCHIQDYLISFFDNYIIDIIFNQSFNYLLHN